MPVASIEDAGPKLVLVDDIITTFVGTAIDLDVLANDRGTGLYLLGVSDPAGGSGPRVANDKCYVDPGPPWT